MKFADELRVQKLPNGRWLLIQNLTFYDVPGLGNVTVPAGFDTDFASVPRLPFMFWFLGDRADYAAVLHDWLYRTANATRREADRAFLWAAEMEGVGRISRWTMWAGLRVGGWTSYDQRHKDNKEVIDETSRSSTDVGTRPGDRSDGA